MCILFNSLVFLILFTLEQIINNYLFVIKYLISDFLIEFLYSFKTEKEERNASHSASGQYCLMTLPGRAKERAMCIAQFCAMLNVSAERSIEARSGTESRARGGC